MLPAASPASTSLCHSLVLTVFTHLFFCLLLCKSTLFIENYTKTLYKLRRCFLLPHYRGHLRSPELQMLILAINRMLLWSIKPVFIYGILKNNTLIYMCIHGSSCSYRLFIRLNLLFNKPANGSFNQ
jgi:hypothetical protein